MSERFRPCRRCKGTGDVITEGEMIDCPRCDGTGMSGDASYYYTDELKKDPIEKENIKFKEDK